MPTQQTPGEKYLEQPDGHSETGDELYCPIFMDRVCGADCIGFDPYGDNKGRTTCLLVNSLKQGASALSVIAKVLQGSIQGSDLKPPGVGQ